MRRIMMMSAATAAILVLGIAGANAEEKTPSPCKGLAEAACKADANCSWVKPGKTKAGKEISGYCRLKPGKKPKAAPTATAPKG